MSVLEARGLACSRGDARLFRDVSFAASPGEWIAVRGANGSGKTTLLRCIAGLTRADSGEVLWDGTPTLKSGSVFRQSMLYSGHAPGLKDELSAVENLRDALALRGAVPADGALREALAERGASSAPALCPARRLSAGQRRRIGLARLALDPAPLWLLDEPLTALDDAGERLFERLLERHLQRGGLALIATHHDVRAGASRAMGA